MKKNLSIISGILLIIILIFSITQTVSIIIDFGIFETSITNIFDIIIASVLAFFAFTKKQLGKLLNILAIIWLFSETIMVVYMLISGIFSIQHILILLTRFFAYILISPFTNQIPLFAKIQNKSVQTDIYEQQLKDGIIKKEEYNSIINQK